jgi:hypothetical protein
MKLLITSLNSEEKMEIISLSVNSAIVYSTTSPVEKERGRGRDLTQSSKDALIIKI